MACLSTPTNSKPVLQNCEQYAGRSAASVFLSLPPLLWSFHPINEYLGAPFLSSSHGWGRAPALPVGPMQEKRAQACHYIAFAWNMASTAWSWWSGFVMLEAWPSLWDAILFSWELGEREPLFLGCTCLDWRFCQPEEGLGCGSNAKGPHCCYQGVLDFPG